MYSTLKMSILWDFGVNYFCWLPPISSLLWWSERRFPSNYFVLKSHTVLRRMCRISITHVLQESNVNFSLRPRSLRGIARKWNLKNSTSILKSSWPTHLFVCCPSPYSALSNVSPSIVSSKDPQRPTSVPDVAAAVDNLVPCSNQ